MKNMLGLIILLGLDNNMFLRPMETIVWPTDIDWGALDKQASRLTILEAEIFAAGEDSDRHALIVKYDLSDIDKVLNEIFDGDMNNVFFY